MGVEEPVLRQLGIFVPAHCVVWAGVGDRLLAFRLDWVDDDDTVVALCHCAVFCGGHTWRIVAVLAHDRNVGNIHDWAVSALAGKDVDPPVVVARHRCRVAFKLVPDVFVLVCQRAQVAVRAFGNVDDQVPLFHADSLSEDASVSANSRRFTGVTEASPWYHFSTSI